MQIYAVIKIFSVASGKEVSGVLVPLAGAVCVVLFLLPGLALSLGTHPRHAAERVATSVILSSLAGYVCFWTYLASPSVGRVFTGAVLLASVTALGWAGRAVRSRVFSAQLLRLLLLQMSAVVVYCSVLNLVPFEGNQGQLANLFFFPQWNDNVFQDAVASRLFVGAPVFELNGWRLSERPPLQAGLLLLTGVPALDSSQWLQAMGVAINSSWLVVVAYLGTVIGLRQRAVGRVVLLCVLIGFFFNSSVFVWPKMLAGSLVVLGAAFWWYSGSGEHMAERLWLGICAWGGAWFAHPSTGFNILLAAACGLAVVIRMVKQPSKNHFWTLAVIALTLAWLIVPWSIYKQLQEGSADVLLKYHMGGTFYQDSGETPAEVVLSAYREQPIGDTMARKLNNLQTLLVPMGDYGEGAIEWRRRDYYHLFFALGVLNVGWLLWLPRGRWDQRKNPLGVRPEFACLAAPCMGAGLVLLTWILVEFGPSREQMNTWVAESFNPPIAVTILHQGSYAPYIILAFAAAALTQTLRGWAWRLLATIHIAIFVWFYVLTPRDLATHWEVDLWTALLGVLGLTALAAGCLMPFRHPEKSTDDAPSDQPCRL